MKKILLLVIVCVLCTACAKNTKGQIQEQLDLGNKYLEEQDYEQAIVAFNKVIELDDKEIRAYIGLGDVYKAQAEEQMAKDLELSESGESLELEELFEKAVSSYQRAEVLETGEELSELISKNRDEIINEMGKYYLGKADKILNAKETLNADETTEAVSYLKKTYELKGDECLSEMTALERMLFYFDKQEHGIQNGGELEFFGRNALQLSIDELLEIGREYGFCSADTRINGEEGFSTPHDPAQWYLWGDNLQALQYQKDDYAYTYDVDGNSINHELSEGTDMGFSGLGYLDSMEIVFDKLGLVNSKELSDAIQEIDRISVTEVITICGNDSVVLLPEYSWGGAHEMQMVILFSNSDYQFDLFFDLENYCLEEVEIFVRDLL